MTVGKLRAEADRAARPAPAASAPRPADAAPAASGAGAALHALRAAVAAAPGCMVLLEAETAAALVADGVPLPLAGSSGVCVLGRTAELAALRIAAPSLAECCVRKPLQAKTLVARLRAVAAAAARTAGTAPTLASASAVAAEGAVRDAMAALDAARAMSAAVAAAAVAGGDEGINSAAAAIAAEAAVAATTAAAAAAAASTAAAKLLAAARQPDAGHHRQAENQPEPGEEAAQAPVSSAAPAAGSEATGAELRALVVDDNSINRKVATAILKSAGQRIAPAIACDGEEAVAAVTAAAAACRPFAIVFMDIQVQALADTRARSALRRPCCAAFVRPLCPLPPAFLWRVLHFSLAADEAPGLSTPRGLQQCTRTLQPTCTLCAVAHCRAPPPPLRRCRFAVDSQRLAAFVRWRGNSSSSSC